MKHLITLKSIDSESDGRLLTVAAGKFYTAPLVSKTLATSIETLLTQNEREAETLRIIDPFAGDGRLVLDLLETLSEGGTTGIHWDVTFIDINPDGLQTALDRLEHLKSVLSISLTSHNVDAFTYLRDSSDHYDIVITNPPWENLKPDRRETGALNCETKKTYISQLREYDNLLKQAYPRSQPQRKFAGWGTNLSRVGLELCARLVKEDGLLAIIMPASFLADEQSVTLRKHFLTDFDTLEIRRYPSKSRLFESADVDAITIISRRSLSDCTDIPVYEYDADNELFLERSIRFNKRYLERTGYTLPVQLSSRLQDILEQLSATHPTWEEFEGDFFWAGREIDETGSVDWPEETNEKPGNFLKGRMIQRFKLVEQPTKLVPAERLTSADSNIQHRIVWRDVSRPTQKRRLIATIIPPGFHAGNSLGVLYLKSDKSGKLKALLNLISSTTFEIQLRARLATGHVSLRSLRRVPMPNIFSIDCTGIEFDAISIIPNTWKQEADADAFVAKHLYGLSEEEYSLVISFFPKFSDGERSDLLSAFRSTSSALTIRVPFNASIASRLPAEICNHYSPTLSKLDLEIIRHVPEGGNWKNIPESVPSKRLEQIRESYGRGEGSRSTYYGRLRRDAPAYTINTYFGRPGNGCHIHYEQDRVLSEREAARFQAFPDSFFFEGTHSNIATQIGNAVPPLLACQIALALNRELDFVDLFAGAGGLGLGFKWAGCTPLIANDIEDSFLRTYRRNVHGMTLCGSILDDGLISELAQEARALSSPSKELWVLGGPPCQGFSTAGNRRTMDDPRNHLFLAYIKFLEELQPHGFIFENVPGLLTMNKGAVFYMVKSEFSKVMPFLECRELSADRYGVPQRRKRVFLIGSHCRESISWPEPITSSGHEKTLFGPLAACVTATSAISDLPFLTPGEDGSLNEYRSEPVSLYQDYCRGRTSALQYLASFDEKS